MYIDDLNDFKGPLDDIAVPFIASGRTQNGPILALLKDGQIFTERFTNSGGSCFQLVRGNLFEASDLETTNIVPLICRPEYSQSR